MPEISLSEALNLVRNFAQSNTQWEVYFGLLKGERTASNLFLKKIRELAVGGIYIYAVAVVSEFGRRYESENGDPTASTKLSLHVCVYFHLYCVLLFFSYLRVCPWT